MRSRRVKGLLQLNQNAAPPCVDALDLPAFERRDQLAILEVRDVGGFVDGLACGLCSLEQLKQLALLCRHGVLLGFCWLRQKAEEGERSDVHRRGTGNTGAQAFGAGRPLNGAAG